MIRNYWLVAWRSLLRNKVFSIINIVGLAIGLTCAMLIILYTLDELHYDRFQKNSNIIYRIVSNEVNPDGEVQNFNGSTGYFHGPTFATAVPEITDVIRLQSSQRDILKGTEVIREDAHQVDTTFFTTFSFPLLYGDAKTALTKPRSVILSKPLALKYFGTSNAVGKTLMMKEDSAFVPYEVTAIAQQFPQNSSIKCQLITPIVVPKEGLQNKDNWYNFFLNTFVVLPKGADPALVAQKMQQFFLKDAKLITESNKKEFGITTNTEFALQPFLDIHLNTKYGASNGLSDGSDPLYAFVLSGIALFILLIACINFINLTIARSVKRAREIGIRKVIGGSRKQLIVQFLCESLILCLFAFALALCLVQLFLPTFNYLSNKALSFSGLFNTYLFVGYVSLVLVTAFLAGFYPAIVLSSLQPVQTLYQRFTLGGNNYLMKGLVVVQFALATIFIITSVVVFRQFNFLTTQPLGYDDSDLVVVEMDGMGNNEYKRFNEMLVSNPQILGTTPKNSGWWGTSAKINGVAPIQFTYETVDPTYLSLLKIPLKSGRNFRKDLVTDSITSVLVNEAFVRKAGWKKPLGEAVNFWYRSQSYKVVGVVKDYHYDGLNRTIAPQLFTMHPGNLFGKVLIKIKKGTEQTCLNVIQHAYQQVFPQQPFSYKFLHDENLGNYEREAKWRQILLFGALVTIFIACIGLFGLSILAAEKRVKEVGIRKVLGASVAEIVLLLSKDFISIVLFSLVLSIPIAYFIAHTILKDYPYHISLGVYLFAIPALLVLVVALFTISIQSFRAALANTALNLRSE